MFFVFRLTSLVYNIVLYYSLSFTAGAESHSGLRLLAGGVCRKKNTQTPKNSELCKLKEMRGKVHGKQSSQRTKNKEQDYLPDSGFCGFSFFFMKFLFPCA